MRKYVIVDKDTGNVGQTMCWGDDRDFPSNIELKENETVITVDVEDNVDLYNTYDFVTEQFYILDVSDVETEIADLKYEFGQLELILPILQEETWKALGIDETKLSQEWQDRLNRKREIRARLNDLEG